MSRLLRSLALFLLIPGLVGLASIPVAPAEAGAQEAAPLGPWQAIDFTEWSIEGPSSAWAFSDSGRTARRTDNGYATFLVGPSITDGVEIQGTITVEDSDDDDWVGLTFAHQAPHAASGTNPYDFEFVLFDWRRASTPGGPEGSVLARVDRPDLIDNTWLFAAADGPGVELLSERRGPGTGWRLDTSYDIWARYTTSRITVAIDGEIIHDVEGSFPTGRIAIFNDSQEDAVYSDFEYREILSPTLDVSAGPDQTVPEGTLVELEGSTTAASTGLPIDYRATVLADSPISYWPFEAGSGPVAADVVGPVDGSIAGATWIEDSAVRSGSNALRFDGSNDFVSLGRPASLRVGEYSMETWVRLDAYPATGHSSIMRSRTWGQEVFVLQDGRAGTYFHAACRHADKFDTFGTTDLVDGSWHHVVVTKDAEGLSIWVDGVREALVPSASTSCHGTGNFSFGREGDHASNYFAGEMDQWAWYDRALTAEEVETHYCVGSGACGNPVVTEWELIAADGPPITLSSTTDLSPTFVAPDDGVYTFRLTARQGDRTASDIVRVTVTNEDPVVEAAATPAPSDGSVLVTASFSDPGTLDRHRVVVDWGDGSEPLDTPVPVQGSGWGSISAAHVYDAAGTYETTVQVVDDDGGVVAATDQVLITIGGPVRPVPGFALWATDETGTLGLTGRDSTVEDRSHANGTLEVNGDAMAIDGPDATATNPTNETGRNHLVESELSPLTSPPTDYRIEDYQPGGRAALAAGSAYRDLTDECASADSWAPAGPLEAGLYYAPCHTDLGSVTPDGTAFTIASTATVLISGTGHDITPFLDDLAVLSSAADEPIVIAGEGHAFSGAVVATAGELRVSGVDHDFTCGALGSTVLVSGTGHSFDTSECPAADPQAPDATAVNAPPVVSPNLVAAVINAGGPVAPGDDVTFTATITHSGATLAVPGLLQVTNTSDAAATVSSLTATLEVFDSTTDSWAPIEGTATASSVRAIVDGAPAESPDLVGADIAPGATEVAGLSTTFALSPEQLARLDDPAITDVRLSVAVISDGDPSAITQVLRLDDGLVDRIQALGADATAVDATLGSLNDQATRLQVPALAPGESVSGELTVTAPPATPMQPGESNRAFINRLEVLDGAAVAAALTGSASGAAGPISIVGSFASTNVALPIVAADLTTPPSAWQGDSFQISVELENIGSEPATPTVTLTETQRNRKADILVALDASGSNFDSKAALVAEIDKVHAELINLQVDANIGLVATPAPPGTFGVIPVANSTSGAGLSQAIDIQFGGTGEQLFDLSLGALSGAMPFARPDAHLLIIYLADEDDQSQITATQLVNILRASKSARYHNAFTVNAIDGGATGCSGPGGSAQPSTRIDTAVGLLGGSRNDICQPPYNAALTSFGNGFGLNQRFGFDGADPATIDTASIVVSVNGVVSPQANWSLVSNPGEPAFIEFSGQSIPGSGDSIEISYDPVCN